MRQISQKPAIPLIKPDEPEAARRSPSPARNPTNRIVHVRNLVRPFTLGQLKELLKRNGPFDEEIFWIDRIKSHCFVTVSQFHQLQKTCLKQPLKNRQNKGLQDEWWLNEGQKYCRMLSWSILQYF